MDTKPAPLEWQPVLQPLLRPSASPATFSLSCRAEACRRPQPWPSETVDEWHACCTAKTASGPVAVLQTLFTAWAGVRARLRAALVTADPCPAPAPAPAAAPPSAAAPRKCRRPKRRPPWPAPPSAVPATMLMRACQHAAAGCLQARLTCWPNCTAVRRRQQEGAHPTVTSRLMTITPRPRAIPVNSAPASAARCRLLSSADGGPGALGKRQVLLFIIDRCVPISTSRSSWSACRSFLAPAPSAASSRATAGHPQRGHGWQSWWLRVRRRRRRCWRRRRMWRPSSRASTAIP